MNRVIVVDDDQRTRRVLQILVTKMGLECQAFAAAMEAIEYLESEKVTLILTDLKMPRMDGIAFMRSVRKIDHEVPVIVLTAYGTVETAVEAMKLGAVDYLAKPFDLDALEALIWRSLELVRYRRENRFLREEVDRRHSVRGVVAASVPMRRVLELVEKVAPTRSAVLITGETGTGKEVVSRAIHDLSPRKSELFVPLNCTAVPRELLESELFGHVRGAFSGASANRQGKFQAADGGTLFLDEIGDMEPGLQAKLLRVLEDGMVEPVGSDRRIPVDVRVVSSTNRDLEREVQAGQFRGDLFYRLNVFRIELAPLRERPADLLPLATTFLHRFGPELGKGKMELQAEAVEALAKYPWPGNVRELRNIMERAAVLSEAAQVSAALLRSLLPQPAAAEDGFGPSAGGHNLASAVNETERRSIERALDAAGDNKRAAAELLGIGERTLWAKLKKHGL